MKKDQIQALPPLSVTLSLEEYQGLLDGVENLNLDDMRAVLRRYLRLVMGL